MDHGILPFQADYFVGETESMECDILSSYKIIIVNQNEQLGIEDIEWDWIAYTKHANINGVWHLPSGLSKHSSDCLTSTLFQSVKSDWCLIFQLITTWWKIICESTITRI